MDGGFQGPLARCRIILTSRNMYSSRWAHLAAWWNFVTRHDFREGDLVALGGNSRACVLIARKQPG